MNCDFFRVSQYLLLSMTIKSFLRRHWERKWTGFWVIFLVTFPFQLLAQLLRGKRKNRPNYSPSDSHVLQAMTARQLESVLHIQKVFRSKFYRFDRIKLIDRLVIESLFLSTTVRFILLCLLFASITGIVFSAPFDSIYVMQQIFTQARGQTVDISLSLQDRQALINQNSLGHSYLVESRVIGSTTPVSLTQYTGSGITINGYLYPESADVTNGSVASGSCINWTLNGVSSGATSLIPNMGISLTKKKWTHVALTANTTGIYAFKNGALLASFEGPDMESTYIPCLYRNLLTPEITGVKRKSFSIFGKQYAESEMGEYLYKYGMPRMMYVSGVVPGTLNLTKSAETAMEEILLPQITPITSGIISFYSLLGTSVERIFGVLAEWGGPASAYNESPYAQLNGYVSVPGSGYRVTLPFMVLSKGQPLLGVLDREFDSVGNSLNNSHFIHTFLVADMTQLVPWFIVNVLVAVLLFMRRDDAVVTTHAATYGEETWFSRSASFLRSQFDSAEIMDKLVVVANIIFSIYFFVIFSKSRTYNSEMLAKLFSNLESTDGIADLVYNSLLPRSEEQQRLIYFGGLFVLYLVIWRTFACMRLHPRVGLFVNTLSFSMSELLHYLVSFFIVATGLAIIGVFTFSNKVDVYTTVSGSFYELFTILLGDDWSDVGTEWRGTALSVIYYVVLPVLCIFTLLNFFLAVIVDTYVKVREQTVESNSSHQSIFLEMFDVPKSSMLYWLFNLPRRSHIIAQLEQMRIQVVTVRELSKILTAGENMTRDSFTGIVKFCQYYHSFPFLKEDSGLRRGYRQYFRHYRHLHGHPMADSIRRDNRMRSTEEPQPGEKRDITDLLPIDAETDDIDARMKIIATELHSLLVANHIRNQEMEQEVVQLRELLAAQKAPPIRLASAAMSSPKSGVSPRDKLISTYQAERVIDNLTNAQMKSRRMKEYMRKAKKDAELIMQGSNPNSTPNSRVQSLKRKSVFESLVLENEDGFSPLTAMRNRTNRASAVFSRASSTASKRLDS